MRLRQCSATREITLWERVKQMFGMFVPIEAQCIFYDGHEADGLIDPRQARHVDALGNEF